MSTPTFVQVDRSVADLAANTINPRTLKDKAFKELKESLDKDREFIKARPIIVSMAEGRENTVIAGNMRLQAIKSLGWATVPVVEVRDASVEQEKEWMVKDNLHKGEWDFEMLANNFDLAFLMEMGFDEKGLNKVLANVDNSVDDEFDAEKEVEAIKEPVVQRGDIWQLGEHRLMCGDSTDAGDVALLMGGKKADMVFTDPPYGIAFTDTKGNTIQNDDLNDEKLADFNKQWQESADVASKGDCFLLAWQSPRKFHLLEYFGNWKFFRLITMYKSNRISFPHGAWINKTEPCCVFAKGQPRITKQEYMDDCYVYKHDKESHEDSNVGHPTPKPVKMVMSNIQACAKKDDLILDLFLGSGSTLIACENTGRICYGMEIDPKYCDVIIKRWEEKTSKKAVKVSV